MVCSSFDRLPILPIGWSFRDASIVRRAACVNCINLLANCLFEAALRKGLQIDPVHFVIRRFTV